MCTKPTYWQFTRGCHVGARLRPIRYVLSSTFPCHCRLVSALKAWSTVGSENWQTLDCTLCSDLHTSDYKSFSSPNINSIQLNRTTHIFSASAHRFIFSNVWVLCVFYFLAAKKNNALHSTPMTWPQNVLKIHLSVCHAIPQILLQIEFLKNEIQQSIT